MVGHNAIRRDHPHGPSAARAARRSGLRHGLTLLGALACLLATVALAMPGPARAQSGDLRGGELNPFPKDDVYQLHFIGDWWMDGLEPILTASLKSLARIRINDDKIEVITLRRSGWADNLAAIKARSEQTQLDIAVVMFGASEIGSLFTPERHRFSSDGWLKRYATRVDSLMKALKAQKGAVYWIGLPIVRRQDHSEGFQLINSIIRERAYLNGINFIDTYARFQDENGAFNRYGPDLDGAIKLLRTKDGVYFTSTGYSKIAQLVMQMIRRDLKSVASQRVVSLAGSEEELAQIRRASQPLKRKVERKSAKPAVNGAAPSPIYGRIRANGLPADDTAVEVDTSLDGRPLKLHLELPRPALSAAVMSLVTRNQSRDRPARLGDNAVLVAAGGVPLLSTITPADQSALALRKRRLSPTQSTFFKVWGKGERLDPKPGRADDFQWPRPAPEPVVHATASPADRAAAIDRAPPRDPDLPPLPQQNPRR